MKRDAKQEERQLIDNKDKTLRQNTNRQHAPEVTFSPKAKVKMSKVYLKAKYSVIKNTKDKIAH